MAKRKSTEAAPTQSTPDGEKTIVEIAKQRYEQAKDAYRTNRVLAIEDTRFALGDSENNWQWPDQVYRDRANINKKPCLTVNITAQHCNQVMNEIRQNRPTAKILPVDQWADVKTAEILGGMLRTIQRISNADTAHDTAAEHAILGGEGYWRVVTEYEDYNSFDQCIRVKPIMNPQMVYIDPAAREPDRSDAQWGFVFEDISKDQCRREHPDIDPADWVEDVQRGWVRPDMVRRAEYFWCEYHDDTLLLLEDGTTELKSNIPDEYEVQERGIFAMGEMLIGIVAQRPTKRKQWKWAKLLGGETKPVDERDWPGSYLPIITVVGKEINVDGEIVRKGLVRDLKDPARIVNYSYSASVETIALQNKVPYLAPTEAIDGFEDVWGAANNENRAYLPYNAFTEDGTPIPRPERQAPAMMPSAQVQMLQLSVEQMRAASGQQNANFGIRSEAQSGIGIQRLKAQGEIATFHFPDNLARALKYEAVVVLDLIPVVYDAQRVVRILGLDGKQESVVLDPEMQQAYAEAKGQLMAKVEKIFNPSVGRYDVAIDTGPSYQTQRQEAADAMTELTTRNPQLMQVAGDIIMKTYDFPMAEELAERLAKTIPPELRDEEEGGGPPPIPPEVQQQMQQLEQAAQQMSEQLQAMQAELEAAKAEQKHKTNETLVKAYEAETRRIEALGGAMSPEAVQMLVLQTLQQAMSSPDPTPEIEPDPPDMGAMELMQEPASAGFSLGESPATGAYPGLGAMPDPLEGNPNV